MSIATRVCLGDQALPFTKAVADLVLADGTFEEDVTFLYLVFKTTSFQLATALKNTWGMKWVDLLGTSTAFTKAPLLQEVRKAVLGGKPLGHKQPQDYKSVRCLTVRGTVLHVVNTTKGVTLAFKALENEDDKDHLLDMRLSREDCKVLNWFLEELRKDMENLGNKKTEPAKQDEEPVAKRARGARKGEYPVLDDLAEAGVKELREHKETCFKAHWNGSRCAFTVIRADKSKKEMMVPKLLADIQHAASIGAWHHVENKIKNTIAKCLEFLEPLDTDLEQSVAAAAAADSDDESDKSVAAKHADADEDESDSDEPEDDGNTV